MELLKGLNQRSDLDLYFREKWKLQGDLPTFQPLHHQRQLSKTQDRRTGHVSPSGKLRMAPRHPSPMFCTVSMRKRAVSPTLNILSPDTHMAHSFVIFMSVLKHHIRETSLAVKSSTPVTLSSFSCLIFLLYTYQPPRVSVCVYPPAAVQAA